MKTRKNIRLKEYDYSKSGMYFVTLCTQDMKYIFGKIVDNKMILNENGTIIDEILKTFNSEKYDISFYQIMPNHLHFIIEIKMDNKINLSQIISVLKSKCTFKVGIKDLWQKGFYERVVRDEKEYNQIVKYIDENPYREKYHW